MLGAVRLPRRRLSSEIFAFQAIILIVTGTLGAGLALHEARSRLDGVYEQRALAVARSFAVDPAVARAAAGGDAQGVVRRRAEEVRRATAASFVVVTDARGIRLSHPDPGRIGERVSTDPSAALAGRETTGVETGTLGRSARAKVPLRLGGPDGRVVGIVSVGVLESTISSDAAGTLGVVALYGGIALALGLVASLLLARRLKRQTFGLELGEFAALVQEREAMLHGIREGVVAVDERGRVRLVNDEALRLLELGSDVVGSTAASLDGDPRLADLLTSASAERDLLLVRGDRVVVANRMPVTLDGRDLGSVVTLRDRTELEATVRELHDVRSLSDALRAQAHEFYNRLHTVSGLLSLGYHDEAVAFVREITASEADVRAELAERVEDPLLGALLVAKSTVAAELGVALRIAPGTRQRGTVADSRAPLTVLGNLVDNALDAASDGDATGSSGPAWVEVGIATRGDVLVLWVADSGPGVPAGARDAVFDDGYTTKAAMGPGARGVGLALVRRTVTRAGGAVAVGVAAGGGALFRVELPVTLREPAGVAS